MTIGRLVKWLVAAFLVGFAMTTGELGWCLLGAFIAGLGVAELVVCLLERRKARWKAGVEKVRGLEHG